jgi:hypothetical protein
LLARIDGGGNIDTLKLAGSGLNLDLTMIDNGRIQDIEVIDLTGSGSVPPLPVKVSSPKPVTNNSLAEVPTSVSSLSVLMSP